MMDFVAKRLEDISEKGENIFCLQYPIVCLIILPRCKPSLSLSYCGVTKLKAFADHNLNVARMMDFVAKRLENISEKGENIFCLQYPIVCLIILPRCKPSLSLSHIVYVHA